MKGISIYIASVAAAFMCGLPNAVAQEELPADRHLIFSVRAKFIASGLEISFGHPLSERFSIRTALGYDGKDRDEMRYRNRELMVSLLSNSRVYPYGFSVGPYLKLKDSNYNYYHPDEEAMLDAYSSLFFFGAGVAAEYRQKIGARFMISPFLRFGVNRVIIRKDTGPGTTWFSDSFEADPNLGVAVSFVF